MCLGAKPLGGSCRDSQTTPQKDPPISAFRGILQHRFQHLLCVASSVLRRFWHREAQTHLPERLWDQAPVLSGGSPEQIRPDKVDFVQVLETLHDDLRAYIFVFADVGCVARCAVSCRHLRNSIWDDGAFWQFYCGPHVNDSIVESWSCPGSAHALRDAFRRCIFHLDGAWTKDFRAFVDQSRQSPSGTDLSLMLSYARYTASGLMPHDSRPAIGEFTSLICELLGEYSPEKSDQRHAAEAITAQVECMTDVFTLAQIKLVLCAYECSTERKMSAAWEAESNLEPWIFDQDCSEPLLDVAEPLWGNHAMLWFA